MVPETPLTFPGRGKAVPPLPHIPSFYLASQATQTLNSAVELVPITKPGGADGVSVSFPPYPKGSAGSHTSALPLPGSFRSCLLMGTTAAETATINRQDESSLKASGPWGELPQFQRPGRKQRLQGAALLSLLLPSWVGAASCTLSQISPLGPAHTKGNGWLRDGPTLGLTGGPSLISCALFNWGMQ